MRCRLLAVACAAVTLALAGSAGAQTPAPVEGTPFTGVVATFDAPPPGQVTIDWGDGATQPAAVTKNAAGKGEVTATHTYARRGSYTVQVTDKADPNTVQRLFLTVADAPITADGTTFKAAAAPGGVLLATITDANPLGTPDDLLAEVDWGDGTTGPATITAVPGQPGRYEVRAAHTYPDPSSYLAGVDITSTAGGDAKAQAQATADGAPEPAAPATGRVLDFGPGSGPSIAVEDDGTADIVWAVPAPGRTGDSVVFCRLPRGAKGCSLRRRLVVDALTAPVILRDRNGVLRIVISYNGTRQLGGGTMVASSPDDGATWDYSFTRVNTGIFQGRIIDAALSQDGRILFALFGDFLPGDKAQVFAEIGLDRPVLNRVDDPGGAVYSARTVAVLPDGRAVLAGSDSEAKKGTTARAAIRVMANADGTPVDAPWSPIRGGPVFELAANLRGASLLGSPGCDKGIDVAPVRGLRAGTPRPLASDGAVACDFQETQSLSYDAAGGRHVAFLSDKDGCQGSGPYAEDRTCIIYRRARPGGDFGPKTTIAAVKPVFSLQAAAGRDGKGWVVWQELLADGRHVRVTPTFTDAEAELAADHRVALTIKPNAECAKRGPVTLAAQVVGPVAGRPRITGVTWSTTSGLLPRRQVDARAPFQTRVTLDRRPARGLSSTGIIVWTATVKARVRTRLGTKATKVSTVRQTLSFFCGVPFSRVRF